MGKGMTSGRWAATALALAAALTVSPAVAQGQPIRAVLEAEVTILDPHFTTAYISRTFGYAVYDTLFGMDSKGVIQPQMAESWQVSDDKLTYSFTLREGLKWHDGQPVTAADCVASIKRWAPRAAFGRPLMAALDGIEAVDARTFRIKLKEPFGLLIEALGRPNSPGPFMMPERLANTPGSQRVTDFTGSGPFRFRADLYRPGDRIVLDRNADYVPRSEPADFMAGGKRVKVPSVEFKVMPDGATAVSAMQAGEIDYIQYVPFDLLPVLERNRQVTVQGFEGMHQFQGYIRLNHAAKPFDDPEIRRVLWKLLDQHTVLEALGLPARHVVRDCRSFFMCNTPLSTLAGSEVTAGASVEAAKAALAKTKYAGEKVVVLQATDIDALRVSSEVMADLMKRAGFNVDLQAMDWGTVLARRAKKEGWNLFGVHAFGFDLGSPITHFYIANNCNQDYAGWSCDERLTPLLKAFPRAADEAERKQLADRIQTIAFENAPALMWGQLAQPAAYRNALTKMIPSAIPVFWEVEKR